MMSKLEFREQIPTGRLCFVTLIVSMLIVVPTNYQNAIVDQPQYILLESTNNSYYGQFARYLDMNDLNNLWNFLVCGSGIAAIPCSIVLPFISDKFGCKTSLFLFTSVCNIVCCALECAAKYYEVFELFLLSQMFGPGCGWTFAFGLAPIYLAECSPSDKRGLTSSLVSFGFYTGVFLAYIIGIYTQLGTNKGWGVYATFTFVPSVAAMLISVFVPESPKDLYIKQENPEAARKVIRQFYGPQVRAEQIFMEFDDEANLTSTEFSLKELLRERHLRMPMFISVVAQMFVFTSGPIVTMSFASNLFGEFLEPSAVQIVTLVMAIPLPILSLFSPFAMKRFGHRPLLLWGGVAMQISLLVYIIFGAMANFSGIWQLSYVAVSGVVLNMWISALGPLPIGLFFVSEITPQASRTVSSALCIIFSMFTYMAISLTFPILLDRIHYWAVLLLMILPSVVLLVFLWLCMPETSDQSVNVIVDNWITPDRKTSLANERKVSMLQQGRKESLVAGKKVALDDDFAHFAALHNIPLSHFQRHLSTSFAPIMEENEVET